MWFRWSNHSSRCMHLLEKLSETRIGSIRGYKLLIKGVTLFELLEDPYFDLTSIAVFWYSSNYLDGDPVIRLGVHSFDNLAECPLTQESDSTICEKKYQDMPGGVNTKPLTALVYNIICNYNIMAFLVITRCWTLGCLDKTHS